MKMNCQNCSALRIMGVNSFQWAIILELSELVVFMGLDFIFASFEQAQPLELLELTERSGLIAFAVLVGFNYRNCLNCLNELAG